MFQTTNIHQPVLVLQPSIPVATPQKTPIKAPLSPGELPDRSAHRRRPRAPAIAAWHPAACWRQGAPSSEDRRTGKHGGGPAFFAAEKYQKLNDIKYKCQSSRLQKRIYIIWDYCNNSKLHWSQIATLPILCDSASTQTNLEKQHR